MKLGSVLYACASYMPSNMVCLCTRAFKFDLTLNLLWLLAPVVTWPCRNKSNHIEMLHVLTNKYIQTWSNVYIYIERESGRGSLLI